MGTQCFQFFSFLGAVCILSEGASDHGSIFIILKLYKGYALFAYEGLYFYTALGPTYRGTMILVPFSSARRRLLEYSLHVFDVACPYLLIAMRTKILYVVYSQTKQIKIKILNTQLGYFGNTPFYFPFVGLCLTQIF